MYEIIEYPNYIFISLLSQPRGSCVNATKKFESTYGDLKHSIVLIVVLYGNLVGYRNPIIIKLYIAYYIMEQNYSSALLK